MQIPKINKIFVSTGIGRKAVIDNKHIFTALLAIELITGQKPIVTRAKKWVDKFQLKKNMPIGCKVTLRHKNMNQSLGRLISRVLPRMEDFTGHGFLEKRGLPLGQTKATRIESGRQGTTLNWFKWQQKRPRASLATKSLGPGATSPSWLHGRVEPTHSTSTSFGIGEKDFLTFSEGQSPQYDQFDSLYGLDIIIVFSPTKNRYSSQPRYLLSAFQMPLI